MKHDDGQMYRPAPRPAPDTVYVRDLDTFACDTWFLRAGGLTGAALEGMSNEDYAEVIKAATDVLDGSMRWVTVLAGAGERYLVSLNEFASQDEADPWHRGPNT